MNCALHVVGKLPREEKLAADARPHPLVVEDGIDAAAAGDFGAGERRVPMLLRRGAVADESLAPFVEDVAPRVAVAGRGEVAASSACAGRMTCAPGCVFAAEWAPRRFDRRAHRDAFERVQKAAVGVFASCRSRGACRRSPQPSSRSTTRSALPSPSVSLSTEQPRLIDDEHAAVPELEAGGAVELVVKHGALIGLAVVIGIFEDQQAIVRASDRPASIAGRWACSKPTGGRDCRS